MIISSIHDLILESISPNVDKAKSILISNMNEREAHKLALEMSSKDPYSDKRFTPILAKWFIKKLPWEEHVSDIKEYKELRVKVKNLRINVKEQKAKLKLQKDLLESKPEDFKSHYSDLGQWISKAKDLLDLKQYSDEGLEVIGEIKDKEFRYVMYKLENKEQCSVPIIKNMTYCITKDHFGLYGGVPYYPVVRYDQSGAGEQFAMIIPNFLEKNDREAVRNAQNTGRLSSSDRRKIEPLIKKVIPEDDQSDYAHYAIYKKLPNNPTAEEAYELFKKYDLEPQEWPEGENVISKDAEYSFYYAINILKGPFPKGEDSISKNTDFSYYYMKKVLNGPFPKGENAIGKNVHWSYSYAKDILKGPFPKGEDAISQNAEYSYFYAENILNGPFPKGEKAISKNAICSYGYAKKVLDGPFTKGEKAISKDVTYSYYYAKDILNGPFSKGEDTISENAKYSYYYASDVLKGPFPKGENIISENAQLSYYYAIEVLKGRFHKGENTLKKDSSYWNKYLEFLESKGIKI